MKKLILALSLLAFIGCAKVDQTERGVILHGGSVAGTVQPGYAFYIPIYTDIARMPVKVQLETMRLEAGSKDMQKVTVGVNVNFHLDPTKVADIYSKYGSDVVVTALQPKIRETITGVTPQYKPEEMLQKREEVRLRMENALRDKLDSADSHMSMDNGYLSGVAQLVEQLICNQRVIRSSRVTGANLWPRRIMVQFAALSRRKFGFETRRGYYRKTS